MDLDRKAFHKAEYLAYSLDQLEVLTDQMVSEPTRFTPEAREAWKEVLTEQRLDADVLLRNLRASQIKDRQVSQAKVQKSAARSKKLTRRVGRLIGFLGIPLSIMVGGLSAVQMHVGGLVGSVAWLGCSFWLAFYYQGD
ncbi:MAG: hypothetical protein C3F19_09830 [Rhodocyclales bacterium]|nr:MAG: hypothetical protein C3F19_09830 [Rhodocyclales bacterium]